MTFDVSAMKRHLHLASLCVLAVCLPAAASAGSAPNAVPLKGPDIIATLEGKTVVGAYANNLAFHEAYEEGGGIVYWDPRGSATGHWSIVNNLFCTFYDNMQGACFRVERIGANCFDYYSVADTPEAAQKPQEKSTYTARGAIAGQPSTCPDQLQV